MVILNLFFGIITKVCCLLIFILALRLVAQESENFKKSKINFFKAFTEISYSKISYKVFSFSFISITVLLLFLIFFDKVFFCTLFLLRNAKFIDNYFRANAQNIFKNK